MEKPSTYWEPANKSTYLPMYLGHIVSLLLFMTEPSVLTVVEPLFADPSFYGVKSVEYEYAPWGLSMTFWTKWFIMYCFRLVSRFSFSVECP